jgi:hypothetical protein
MPAPFWVKGLGNRGWSKRGDGEMIVSMYVPSIKNIMEALLHQALKHG